MSRINSLFESFGGPHSTEGKTSLYESSVEVPATASLCEKAKLLSTNAKRDFWRVNVDVIMSENGGKNPMSTVVEASDKEEAIEFVQQHFFKIEPQMVKYMRIPANADALVIGDVVHLGSVLINTLPTVPAKLLKEVNVAASKVADKIQRGRNQRRKEHPETPLQIVFVRSEEDGDFDVTSDYIWTAPDMVQRGYQVYTADTKREPLYLFD